jgi:antitoxin CptB
MTELIDERALSKLRWRCRRGLLENDLFVERFFDQHRAGLTHGQARGLQVLMDLPDNDLLDLLLRRVEPAGELLEPDVVDVLRLMRRPARTPGSPAAEGTGSTASTSSSKQQESP